MRLRKLVNHINLAVLFLGAFCSTSSAATLIVGKPGAPCPNARYSTIGAAVSAAASGDIIAICPALYPEQVVLSKPLKLKGISVGGGNRVLIQPSILSEVNGYESVVSVVNTTNVSIENLAIDASHSAVNGCSPILSGLHFFNSSGAAFNNAISGTLLQPSTSCSGLIGNGFGVLVDSDGTVSGPFNVAVAENSIHDYTKDGIYALGPAAGVSPVPVNLEIVGNSITGIGPGIGTLQWGVFFFGAAGRITRNMINEGTCGAFDFNDCANLRSEGIVLRAAGEGTVVDANYITNAQSGIFINGGTKFRITNNVIRNIDALDGIDIQGTALGYFTDSLIAGNTVFNALPLDNESCGVWEFSGTNVSGNTIVNNHVNDTYCGVGYVTADRVLSGSYFNTLYTNVNSDGPSPSPVEPALALGVRRTAHISSTPQ